MIRTTQVHASTVAFCGKGVLILGPSGSGKSTLALQLMAVGAGLVSDDRTDLRVVDGQLIAAAPVGLTGRIESRGIGILAADPVAETNIVLIVDLGRAEAERLPSKRQHMLIGVSLPLVLGPYRPHLYAALRQYLLAGRVH